MKKFTALLLLGLSLLGFNAVTFAQASTDQTAEQKQAVEEEEEPDCD